MAQFAHDNGLLTAIFMVEKNSNIVNRSGNFSPLSI